MAEKKMQFPFQNMSICEFEEGSQVLPGSDTEANPSKQIDVPPKGDVNTPRSAIFCLSTTAQTVHISHLINQTYSDISEPHTKLTTHLYALIVDVHLPQRNF